MAEQPKGGGLLLRPPSRESSPEMTPAATPSDISSPGTTSTSASARPHTPASRSRLSPPLQPPPSGLAPAFPSSPNEESAFATTASRKVLQSTSPTKLSAHRTSHRYHVHHHRNSGSFLLHGTVDGGAGHARSNSRREHSDVQAKHGLNNSHSHAFGGMDGSESTAAPAARTSLDQARTGGARAASPLVPRKHRTSKAADKAAAVPSSAAGGAGAGSGLDFDSAQIVNMALNLSESRRLAAKHVAAQQVPPRLAPLPDSTVGGSLRQQLQQQRRLSRNLSPRPDRGGKRAVSSQSNHTSGQAPRVSSPLQPAFEPIHDGGAYRYHFSQSTLARAQKAKDYLELQAQQRRLLDLVPPLTPAASSRSGTGSLASPPMSSATSGQPAPPFGNQAGELAPSLPLGRPYDPLQYIRNRKVRARERKAIDGQAQGFGDVAKTTEWVDEVQQWVASGQNRTATGSLLPPFASADEVTAALQNSPPAPSRMAAAVATASKPKRPRVDWVIDPADMIADIYWLEQDDNKKLVEDRQWRRVFPQGANAYRPLSRRTEEATLSASSGGTVDYLEPVAPFPAAAYDGVDTSGAGLQPLLLSTSQLPPLERVDEHGTTRDRARQKLHELKGLHQRHNSAMAGHDGFRPVSDSSDSDSDWKKRRNRQRGDTATAMGAEMLRRQMLDMIARENRERADESRSMSPQPVHHATSQEMAAASSHKGHAGHSSEPEEVLSSRRPSMAPLESPIRSGRTSLDIPAGGGRASVDYDSSRPTSPEMRPLSADNIGLVPALGGDLSPVASRTASPPRNRFSKVKSIFRDHSRERGGNSSSAADRGSDERDESTEPTIPEEVETVAEAETAAAAVAAAATTTTGADARPAPGYDDKGTRTPLRKTASGGTGGALTMHKSQSSVSSSGTGLRGFLRGGPRIDTVLRSGVSKVSDMLWRREASETTEAQQPAVSLSDDESEAEALSRGRSRNSTIPSRSPSHVRDANATLKPGAKHYLDVMPTFGNGSSSGVVGEMGASLLLAPPGSADPISRPPSRRSTRFERLKPPRIDVSEATPISTPLTAIPPAAANRAQPVSHESLSESDTPSQSSRAAAGATEGAGGGEGVSTGLPPRPLRFGSTGGAVPGAGDGRRWSVAQPATSRGSLSRRELARLKASMFSSAVLAKELDRRARRQTVLAATPSEVIVRGSGEVLTWAEVAACAREPDTVARQAVSAVTLYPLAAQVFGDAIQRSGQAWQGAAAAFAHGPAALARRQQIETLRSRVAGELSGLARQAADEADDVSRDLVAVQRLKVKHVEDRIETMLRRRRRRFRWVRRGGWLALEWVLVGIMWYVWFVVMLARVVLGVGRGVYACVRWLLWL